MRILRQRITIEDFLFFRIFLIQKAYHFTIHANLETIKISIGEKIMSTNILESGLSAKPALLIDRLILKSPTWHGSKTVSEKAAHLAARIVSVTVLPICLGGDFLYQSCSYYAYKSFFLISINSNSKNFFYLKTETAAANVAGIIRGLFSFGIGLRYPDVVSNHFLPEIQHDKNTVYPYGSLYQKKTDISFPENEEDILKLVKICIDEKKHISIIGAGFSQGKQTLPISKRDICVNMNKMNNVQINIEKKTAIIGGGVTWEKLQNEADKVGLAIRTQQASNPFSAAGSLSIDCHGWDFKSGVLSNTINWVKIVNGLGKIEKIEHDNPKFGNIAAGFGLCGIIVEMEIQLTENEELINYGVKIPIENLVYYFENNIRDNESVRMALYRLSLKPNKLFETGILQIYSSKPSEVHPTEKLVAEPAQGTKFDRIAMQVARLSSFMRTFYWKTVERSLDKINSQTRNQIMRPPILAATVNNSVARSDWLQEYFVPPEHIAELVQYVAKVLMENEVPVINASVRYVPQSETARLGYATEGPRYALVLYFSQYLKKSEVEKTKNWVRKIINEKIIEMKGTFYLAYGHFATREQFEKCYPNYSEFLKMKEEMDPYGIFKNGLYKDYLDPSPSTHLSKEFHKELFQNQNQEIRDFLSNVFQQVDVEAFMKMYEEIIENSENGKQIYQQLLERSHEVKGNLISKIKAPLMALKNERGTLANNIKKMFDPSTSIDGYAEIGFPGRMIKSMEKAMKLSGPKIVVNDQERATDFIQCGFPKSYDRFVALNDYEPLNLEENSLGIISCFIGVHHCPKDKLDAFIRSIYKSLKPGGVFLLRDHDCHSNELTKLASLIHCLFNANTGVPEKEEKNEIRNFQSADYWVNYLANRGLACVSDRDEMYVRDGDPSKNIVIKFVKLPERYEYLHYIKKIMETKNLGFFYNRKLPQTYLTAIEWFNVDSARSLGQFTSDQHENFWDYTYLRDVKELWSIYFNSIRQARKVTSLKDIATSDYGIMNLFISTMMTTEYVAKATLFFPLRMVSKLGFLFPHNEEDEHWNNVSNRYATWLKQYGDSIQEIPSYAQKFNILDYWRNLRAGWSASGNAGRGVISRIVDRQTIKNLATGLAMTSDLTARKLVSAPVNLFYGGADNADAREIGLIIKCNDSALEFGEGVKVITQLENSPYKGIVVKRYKNLEEILIKFANNDIEVIEIAGQNTIKVELQCRDLDELNDVRSEELSVRTCLSNPNNKIISYNVKIEELSSLLKEKNDKLFRIYDF